MRNRPYPVLKCSSDVRLAFVLVSKKNLLASAKLELSPPYLDSRSGRRKQAGACRISRMQTTTMTASAAAVRLTVTALIGAAIFYSIARRRRKGDGSSSNWRAFESPSKPSDVLLPADTSSTSAQGPEAAESSPHGVETPHEGMLPPNDSTPCAIKQAVLAQVPAASGGVEAAGEAAATAAEAAAAAEAAGQLLTDAAAAPEPPQVPSHMPQSHAPCQVLSYLSFLRRRRPHRAPAKR